MSKFAHQLRLTLRYVLALAVTLVIGGTFGLVIMRLHGERLLSVQTASMAPTFRPGDALIVVPAKVKDRNH